MLKLEKNKSDQIKVIIRSREHFYTQSIVFAFFIALFIHLFFLIIFQITPIKIPFDQIIFPPVQVITESFFMTPSVTTQLDSPKYNLNLPAYPASSFPKMSTFPLYLSNEILPHIEEYQEEKNPFEEIEDKIYVPQFDPIIKPLREPLKIVISGNLSKKELIPKSLKDPKLPLIKPDLPREWRLIFSVLVDQSGSVFWFEPRQLTRVQVLDQYAENVLKSLVFAQENHDPITSGEIEFLFNVNLIDSYD